MDDTRETSPLAGCQVAVTGRLASASRSEFRRLIEDLGGQFARRLGPSTTHVIVGEAAWPLTNDGRLTPTLRLARRAERESRPVQILRESEFLSRYLASDGARSLCEESLEHSPSVVGLYTLAHLARELGVTRQRLRSWLARGWIKPVCVRHTIPWFDFQQVAGLRHLASLVAGGVSADRLQRSLRQLGSWLGGAEHALVQLARLQGGGQLVARTPAGQLAEPNGQMLLDFESADDEPATLSSQPSSANEPRHGDPRISAHALDEQQIDEALALEAAGKFGRAARIYAKLLAHRSDDAQLWLNYGNVLCELNRLPQAAEAFCTAVELDSQFVEAWNNLGAALMDLGKPREAERALRRALSLSPTYANARINLADLRGMSIPS